MRKILSLTTATLAGLLLTIASFGYRPLMADETNLEASDAALPATTKTAKAMFAGGCFWSVESDMEKVSGVLDVITGYAGGQSNNPTYQTYAFGGHREVILITYDPQKITYAGLIEHLIKHIDPTDAQGSFLDRGVQYSPAIFVQTDREKQTAEAVLSQISAMKVYENPLAVAILPPAYFWPAEAYHQDYAAHHPASYKSYRFRSGRDSFIRKHWGKKADELQLADIVPATSSQELSTTESVSVAASQAPEKPWESFEKPDPKELRAKLTRMQYAVTQSYKTEPEFRNAYWDNHEEGIYVDIVSGEPLFSSTDKFDSGTGWPSFTKPLEPEHFVSHVDYDKGYPRLALRSKYGECHLGHVFNDGPVATGGMRFCMNSAALKFIPKDKLEEAGYGEYLKLFAPMPSNAK